ncbi:MAG: box helicase protein, partial [Acidimicrobiaceae bacterium]|nr:box helicase protein [Acidimicrobiaceae bacterium]
MADLEEVLRALAADGQLVHLERIPARAPRTASLADPLAPELAHLVPAAGLWTHQASAIDLARRGHSVAVVTGTASGKSLCYQL